jgi:endonuclease YncB( thermonuclease family)
MRYVLFALVFLFSGGSQAFDVFGTGTVWRAVDGDTFWITGIAPGTYERLWSQSRNPDHFNRKHFSVKMRIGVVDTAESVHKDKSKNTA